MFFPISVFFYQTTMWVILWQNHFIVFLNHFRRGSNGENSLLLRNQNRSCDEHQALKQINFNFTRKRRIGRWSNGGMSHFVLCETKPNNLSKLCMTICLCCVWKNIYLCMTIFQCYVWHIFINLFLSVLCMTLNLTSTFSIHYIIQNKMSLLTGVYGHVGHHIIY